MLERGQTASIGQGSIILGMIGKAMSTLLLFWLPGIGPPIAATVDTLIKSLQDNEISPNSNVYAELGTTWRPL